MPAGHVDPPRPSRARPDIVLTFPWSSEKNGSGASNQYDENAERQPAVHNRAETDFLKDDTQIRERVGRPGYNHPVRYLFLTKHDAHPRQLGRIVERINTMGTLRLYAMKDWSAINDADPFIRMLGQELDQKMRNWSWKRKEIDRWKTLDDFRKAQKQEQKKHEERKEAGITEDEKDFTELLEVRLPSKITSFVKGTVARVGVFFLKNSRSIIDQEDQNRIQDVKSDALYQVTKKIESSLIDISTRLDRVGAWCVGGLHFRLYRSQFYVDEFNMLLDTLRVGRAPTWVSYDSFVDRGLQPTFDFIKNVGVRLRALRNRLQSVMDTIETSALVVQSAATRQNTAALRQIVTVGILLLIIFGASLFKETAVAAAPSLFGWIKLPDLSRVPWLFHMGERLHSVWVWLHSIWEWLSILIGSLFGT